MQSRSMLLYKIPHQERKKLKTVKYSKGEFLEYELDSKLVFITQGNALIVRYSEDREVIYPYLIREGDLLGMKKYITGEFMDWDVIAYTETVSILEIPVPILEKYVFSDLSYYNALLKKTILAFQNGVRGFYVKTTGGSKAYLAYLIYILSEEDDGFLAGDNFINFKNVLMTNKSMLYKTVNKLVDEKIIEKEKNRIIIRDRKALIELFSDYFYKIELN